MKNLKYVYKFILAIPLVFMVGCIGTDDYDDVDSNQFSQQSTVFIETDDASEFIRSVPGNQPIPIEVGVNNAPSSDITVSLRVLKDGEPAEEGVDFTTEDAIIYTDDITGNTDVVFLRPGLFEVSVANASDGSLVVADNRLLFKVPPAVSISISWADSFYDYDLYLVTGNQDFGGDIIASSLGVTAFEQIIAYPPEGFSTLFIDDWWDDNAGIDVVMFVEVDGVVDVYDVVMDMDKWVLLIETTINEDGDPVYDFTAL